MHELAVIDSILSVVLRHVQANQVSKVVSVGLRVGEMSDLEDEWMQRYFDYRSQSTPAEGAKLNIERVPVTVKCTACNHVHTINVREEINPACPQCGATGGTLVSGREYFIKEMEVL
jgi:hydrogenase nickel incorporation protein HypA/HybF